MTKAYREILKITEMHKLFRIFDINHMVLRAAILGVLDVSEITSVYEVLTL